MILVLGAEASGKRDYIRSLGYSDSDMADGELDDRPVLMNLQQLVFSDPTSADALLPVLLQKEVVACNEVGSGIIPDNRRATEAREATGRLCIRLAQQATCVVRCVVGIPTVIKGA